MTSSRARGWWLLIFSVIATCVQAAAGEPDPTHKLAGSALVAALQKGGYVIYFRHADTGPALPEREPVDLQRCETQRNLNEHGREQAREIGMQFERLGLPVGDVLVSEFCRCWQTAELAFGRFRKEPILTGISRDANRADQRAKAAAGLRELLAARPSGRANTVLISHGYNLFDAEQFLLGTQGEAAIYLPGGDGAYSLVARLLPEDWARLPRPAP